MDTQSANSPFRLTGKRHRAELEPNETAARSTCLYRKPLGSSSVPESYDKARDPEVQANANAPEKSADAKDPDKSADAKSPEKSADMDAYLLDQEELTYDQVRNPRLFAKDRGALWQQNPHPRDEHIFMHEGRHKYYVNWHGDGKYSSRDVVSASGFASTYFSKFDAVAISARLAPRRGCRPEDLRAEWDRARDEGTRNHAVLEHYFNGDPIPSDMETWPVFQQFDQFVQEYIRPRGLEQCRVEWQLFSGPDLRLVGTVDLVCALPDEQQSAWPDKLKVVLLDHKFSKGIRKTGFGGKMGTGPCKGLPDCNYSKYSLAMRLYRYLLETTLSNVTFKGRTYKGIEVVAMGLDVFHASHDDNRYKFYEVPLNDPVFETAFAQMLQLRRQQVMMQRLCRT